LSKGSVNAADAPIGVSGECTDHASVGVQGKAKTGVLGLGERTGVRGVANDPAAVGGGVLIGVEVIGRNMGVLGVSDQIVSTGRPAWIRGWFGSNERAQIHLAHPACPNYLST